MDSAAGAYAALMRARHMLFAIVRQHGRLAIPLKDLEGVSPKDRLDIKVQSNGDLMVSYLAAE